MLAGPAAARACEWVVPNGSCVTFNSKLIGKESIESIPHFYFEARAK